MRIALLRVLFFPLLLASLVSCHTPGREVAQRAHFIDSLLAGMSLEEKLGQLSQYQSTGLAGEAAMTGLIRNGLVGSVLNEVDPDLVNRLQREAVQNSPSGIPVLFARDVIHGFNTVFPVNIGMAASFNPELVADASHVAALEASSKGVRWTFAPMVDVSRDPRWGRMAESFGEDPFLVTLMGLASMEGFTRKGEKEGRWLASTAKHFAGYGAVEGGRDYNTVSIPQVELYNTYFPPFKALAEHGVQSFMSSFSELNGVPCTGNSFLFRQVLREEWDYQGLSVSDWESVTQMVRHGFAADEEEAAFKAMTAGIDMEMQSHAYLGTLPGQVEAGRVDIALIDEAVKRVIGLKYDLGLFDDPYVDEADRIDDIPREHLDIARELATQSLVLLRNENGILPLSKAIGKVAVLGPMADDAYEQMGTWTFDGDTNLSVTPLEAITQLLGTDRVMYEKALSTTRDGSMGRLDQAMAAARSADAVLFFAGEEAILTGEAHCRSELGLPGAQQEMIQALSQTGKPLILVVMTPRPLALGDVAGDVDAILYAWHPGSMAGPAIADVVFGTVSPSGKLPVSFPKNAGQVPIYYNHKNTGNPPSDESWVRMEDIPVREFQTSLGNTSHYLDIGFEPQYPFGYGLSYTTFEYGELELSGSGIGLEDSLVIMATLTNSGPVGATEVAQLYVRDLVASVTRPVRELKGFQRIRLEPGESRRLRFVLYPEDLAFYDAGLTEVIEPGEFQVWVGTDSRAALTSTFILKSNTED